MAVRNSLLEGFSGNKLDAARKLFPDFPEARHANLPKFGHSPTRKMTAGTSAPPSGTWTFSSETVAALSFSEEAQLSQALSCILARAPA